MQYIVPQYHFLTFDVWCLLRVNYNGWIKASVSNRLFGAKSHLVMQGVSDFYYITLHLDSILAKMKNICFIFVLSRSKEKKKEI